LVDVFSEIRVDPSSDSTIVGQIRSQLTLLIADGRIEPGSRLPAVRTLAELLDINVNTVRSAYARLEEDGLVATRHGVGTIVQPLDAGTLKPGASRYLSNTVGVLIAGLDPFYLEMLRGIEAKADEQGLLVLIFDSQDSSPRAAAAIRQLTARGAQGIIAVSIGAPGEGSAEDALPPIVYVDQPGRSGQVLLFDVDRAGYDATRHLLQHGHRRIGFVSLPIEWPNQRELFDGYRRALREEGVDPDASPPAVVEDFGVASGRSGLAELLERGDAPTAVVTSGAMLAVGVLQEAQLRGSRVPADLAIIGFADVEVTKATNPPLTMVSLPVFDIGFAAMSALQRMMGGSSEEPTQSLFAGTLEIRESCGPHPAD
jgi:LacI family repressor for deo operon, udp, cdd, tsx, nupC, and nupG